MSNTVTVVGTIADTPELRRTRSGTPVTNFSVEVCRTRTDKSGKTYSTTSLFDVTCWWELAENVTESLFHGDNVVVVGRLEQKRWETRSGEKRHGVHIVAEDVAASLKSAILNVQNLDDRDHRDSYN